MNLKKLVLLPVLFFVNELIAQSYEGYIGDNLPVWLDVDTAGKDSGITASYFYKNIGVGIRLAGEKKGNKITLTETNRNKVTAFFSCISMGDSMTGSWQKSAGKETLTVRLYRVPAGYKQISAIPGLSKLVLTSGKTLNDAINEKVDERGKIPVMQFHFAEKAVASGYIKYYTGSSRQFEENELYNFNLAKKKQILLTEEITVSTFSDFKKKISGMVQDKFNEHRNKYTEQEWLSLFGDNRQDLDSRFTVGELSNEALNIFFIKHDGVYIRIVESFGLPDFGRAMWLYADIKISFGELCNYLNRESVLRNFCGL